MKDKHGNPIGFGDIVLLPQGGAATAVGETNGFAVVESGGSGGARTHWLPEVLVKSLAKMPKAEQFAPAEPSETPEWFNEGVFWKSQFEAANRDARHYLQELGEKTRLLSDAMGLLSTAAPFMESKLSPSTDTRLEWMENLETLHDELESPE